MYPVHELITCLPNDKAFGHTAKYHAHLKQLEDLHWSLNQNALPDIRDHNTMPHRSSTGIDQITCNDSDLTGKSQSPTYQQLHTCKSSSGSVHIYNLHP